MFFFWGGRGAGRNKKIAKKNAVASGLCLYSWEPQNLSQRIETYPVSPSKLWTCSLRGNLQGWTWIHQVFFFNFWPWEPFFFRGNLLGLTKAPLQIMNLFDWTWTHQVFYFNFWSWDVGHTIKDLDPPSLAIHSHLGETSLDSPRFPCKLWTCSLRGNPQGWTRAHQAYPSFDKTNGPWCSFIL